MRIGSVAIPSSSFTSWSSSAIRFRIPLNTPSGNLTVRTSEGTSNAIRLQITSPYLTSISPTQVKTGGRLTLTGGNFGTRRGSGYVSFFSNVRPSAADYVSWSNSRIVVKVPVRAQSGNVQVVSANGRSGTRRIVVESSPQITSVSPRQVLYDQVVTVTGINFGSSRGSSSVRIGSQSISSLASWSNTIIRFRVPTNMALWKSHRPHLERNEQRHPLGDNKPLLGQCFAGQCQTRRPSDADWGQFQEQPGERLRSVHLQCPANGQRLRDLERQPNRRQGSGRGAKRRREGRRYRGWSFGDEAYYC